MTLWGPEAYARWRGTPGRVTEALEHSAAVRAFVFWGGAMDCLSRNSSGGSNASPRPERPPEGGIARTHRPRPTESFWK
jgi:hypothetical protein